MNRPDTLLLWDFFLEERLGEMEAWALLCQGCQLLSAKLEAVSGQCYGDIYESFLVSDRRLELSEHGLVFNDARKIANVRDYLPAKMKPLLELSQEDLGRLGSFSLAKMVLANIENIKSVPLYNLLSALLSSHITSIPLLATVTKACLDKISLDSSKRILSSMFFKHQGRCQKEYGARNFSTIRSLPSLALHSDLNEEDTIVHSRKMSSFLSQRSLRRDVSYYEQTAENEKSISGVCNYIRKKEDNSADVFNLLDLPGLKYNRHSFNEKDNNQNNNLTPKIAEKRSVQLVLLDNQVMEVSLGPKDTSLDLLILGLDQMQQEDRDQFGLCKKVRGEFLYLKSSERLSDFTAPSGVATFHVRMIKPPSMQIRKQFARYLQLSDNFGKFSYTGKDHKGERCGSVNVNMDICGLKINDNYMAWRQVKQVAFSHTYLQIITLDGDKIKICFSAAKTKHIYDLVVFLIEANKEMERSKAKEMSNLDDLCDQLMKITKGAMKVMTTPQRKRTKTQETGSASKKQKLAPCLGFSERKRKPLSSVQDGVVGSQYQYQYKLYLENEEDEIYVHMDQLKRHMDKENIIPRIKTRIATNPTKTFVAKPRDRSCAETSLESKLELCARPRQGPVIMGTSTLKRKLTNNFDTEPAKKIVCVSVSKMEYLSLKVNLAKSEDSIVVEKIVNQTKKKILTGDKIVAVNGKTLEDMSLEKANFIINNSGHLLNFILQR